jgi:beta-glucanase (GH16 family)
LTAWVNPRHSSTATQHSSAIVLASGLDTSFHDYAFDWKPSMVDFFLDGQHVSTIDTNVPSEPAYMMMSIWGTNGVHWGGPGTPGVRYLYVSRVAFEPLKENSQ